MKGLTQKEDYEFRVRYERKDQKKKFCSSRLGETRLSLGCFYLRQERVLDHMPLIEGDQQKQDLL